MKLSVVIPVYKVEPYLERCVKSVYRQTFRDMEIIMVDDGSPDDSGKLADRLAAQDSRARVIHQENQGLSGARNTGLRVAQGDYVVFLDSDDEWIIEDGIETLLRNDGADLIIFKAVHIWKDHQERTSDFDIDYINSLPNTQDVFSHLVRSRQFQVSACKLLVRRQLLIDNNIFFPLGYINEDIDWSFRLWQKATKVVFTNLDFYGNHHRPGSITQTTDIRSYQSYDKIFSYWKEACQHNCVNAGAIQIYLANLWVSGGYFYYQLSSSQKKEALKILKKHKDLLKYAYSPIAKGVKTLVKIIGIRMGVVILGIYKRVRLRTSKNVV
ncbi:MAG: glycosyltransferase [Bacteroidaceae bacterium]|nr:glycosyltransferase [Bacteroidaceae bacterium]